MNIDLFGKKQKAFVDPYKGRSKAHPARPGTGPKGETCRTCANRKSFRYHMKFYHKCNFVKWSHGLGTDLRLKDPACKFWEKKC